MSRESRRTPLTTMEPGRDECEWECDECDDGGRDDGLPSSEPWRESRDGECEGSVLVAAEAEAAAAADEEVLAAAVALVDAVPYDVLDAALADTVARFPVDIVPFKDMVRNGGGRGGGGSNSVSRFCRRGGADAKTLKNLPVFSLVRRIWRRAHQANNRKPCRHTFTYHP